MNTFKSFVRNIAERNEDRKVGSPTIGDNAEGFLCPMCMQSFENPEALQSHFLTEHDSDVSNNRSSDFGDIEDESFDFRDESSLNSEGSSLTQKTPSGSERLNQSVSDFSLSQSKFLSSKEDSFKNGECGQCLNLTQEHDSLVADLKSKIESLNQNLTLKDKEMEERSSLLTKETKDLKDVIQSKEDEIIVLKESINVLKCDKNEFVQSESAKVFELETKYGQALKDCSAQSQTLNELKKKYEDEKLEKEQLLCTLSEKDKKVLATDKLLGELRSQITQFEEDRAKLLREIELGEGTNMALDQLKQENEQLSKQIRAEKSASEQIEGDLQCQISKLNQELLEAKSKCLSLSDSLKELNEKMSRISSDYEAKSSENKDIVNKLESKKKEVENLNFKYKELESKLNQASEKNLEVSIEKNNFATKVESLSKILEDLKTSNSSFQEQIDEKGSLIEDLRAEKDTLSSEKSQLKSIISKKEEENNSLSKEIDKTRLEKDSQIQELEESNYNLQSENSSLKLDKNNISLEKIELEERICSLQKGYEVKIEELNQNLEEARISLDSFAIIKKEQLEKLKNLEEERNGFRDEKESLSKELKIQTDQLKKSIINLEKEKDERVSFYEDKISDLSNCLEKATNDLNELKRESEEFERVKQKLEKSVNESLASRDALLSQKLELEAVVGASNDERKALLERCLGAETELDRSRSNCIELRRKLDDSQAALHELGRENQSIQLELNKLTGRKWADDSDVKECVGCKNQFSITIRKHHCRNCGQIFCKDCSSKTSSNMTNYTKPQRVCDGCYEELAVK